MPPPLILKRGSNLGGILKHFVAVHRFLTLPHTFSHKTLGKTWLGQEGNPPSREE